MGNSEINKLTRREFIKKAGIGTAALGAGALAGERLAESVTNSFKKQNTPTGLAHGNGNVDFTGEVRVEQGNEYEIWIPQEDCQADVSGGSNIENVLIDLTQTSSQITFDTTGSDYTLRNIGFKGASGTSDPTAFCFQPSHAGLIENVYATGFGTELGGLWYAGGENELKIRNSYFAGFGNNSIYGAGPGKQGDPDGSPGPGGAGKVIIDSCYSNSSTTGNFRVGTPGSQVTNSLVVIDDPECRRGEYKSNSSKGVRPISVNHGPDQIVENCSVYVSADDCPGHGVSNGGAIHAWHCAPRACNSQWNKAVATVRNCDVVNEKNGGKTASSRNAEVVVEDTIGDNPTVEVLKRCGVPMSAKKAAQGMRKRPNIPDIGGQATEYVKASECSGSPPPDTSPGTPGTSPTPETNTITISSPTRDPKNYIIETTDKITRESSTDTEDSIFGNKAVGETTGSVRYKVEGKITGFKADENVEIKINGEEVSQEELFENHLSCQT